MAAERRFSVMGTTAHVVVVARSDADATRLVDRAEARLRELELRWSRFLPDSDISRCNQAGGAPVTVSRDTQILVERALDGWERTAGRFDPTILPALVAAGYDATFPLVAARVPTSGAPLEPFGPASGCWGIQVSRRFGTVTVPAGVGIDPGGVGKGLATDFVVAELLASGARGVCINVGGDLRVAGEAPEEQGWVVALDHPLGDSSSLAGLGEVHLASGAVASTWTTRRAWGPDHDRRHHVIDPESGRPARTGVVGVVVLTAAAWWAEVLATAALLSGDRAAAFLEGHGATGLVVDDDGGLHEAGAMQELQPCWA